MSPAWLGTLVFISGRDCYRDLFHRPSILLVSSLDFVEKSPVARFAALTWWAATPRSKPST